ncbi:MAG: pyridine nucleotide-disulfide oxidoreductase [Firmicutes bacterium ZCTH02-B6]|nr:MAG: pyridine nucleotide-disulfide oxidoreductase [Firmicutes bacterium ZCTH02-B6]
MASSNRTYVIIGNGIAGTNAAERLRKEDPTSRVVVIAAEPYPLYNRVALPKFLKRQTPISKVMLRDVEWHKQLGIELHLETRATKVDVETRTVVTDKGQEFVYDKLLVATGGRPNPLRVPGGNSPGVYNFQTLDDAKAIEERVTEARSAVTVGGSYIAYELTDAFSHRGLETTWLIRGPRFLHRILDEDGGKLVDMLAREAGVNVLYGEEVAEVVAQGGTVTKVITTGGRTIEADLVGVGIGMALNTEVLEGTGVQVRKGIVTDASMRTNVPDIFAAGDVCEFYDVTVDAYSLLGTWANASSHGKVAAAGMLGAAETHEDVPAYSSTLFNSTLSVVGLTPEARPDLESVSRVDWESKSYRRLFFLGNRLVGAVFIGGRKGKRQLTDMIRERTPVEGPREKLLEI